MKFLKVLLGVLCFPMLVFAQPALEGGAFIGVANYIGLKAGINDKWGVGLEFGLRKPFTDYLDGVSESGNPDKGDWFLIGGASLSYQLK